MSDDYGRWNNELIENGQAVKYVSESGAGGGGSGFANEVSWCVVLVRRGLR